MTCPKVIKVKTPGPPGPAGNPGPPGIGAAWQQGAGVPGSGVGATGDFYLNTSNGDIYGPKTSGGWGSVIFNIAEGQDGRDIELGVSATHIQWRYAGDTGWINLVALSTITGPPVPLSDGTPQPLAASGSPGTASQAARADHKHIRPTPAEIGADASGTAAAAVAAHVAAADPHPGYLTAAEGNAAYATAAQGALAATAIQPGNTALSDAREWSADTISQAEAEAGTATTRRAFTALRVFQAIASWWNGSAAKTKLDGIQDGAQANVATNLSYDAASREVRSSTGDDATLPLASTTAAGLAPATGTPTGKYLKDDLTWAPVSAAPGGSSGQVQFNNGGAFGGLSTLTADGSGNLTLSARLINSFNAAASAPAKLFSGTWFTGGTTTTTKPHLLIEPAGTTSTNWNTAGTGFAVNAAAGFGGDLAWFGVNGSSYVKITAGTNNIFLGQSAGAQVTNYGGIVAIGQNAFSNTSTAGINIVAVGPAALRYLSVTNGSTEAVGLGANAGGRILAATSSVLLGAYAGQGSTGFSAQLSRTTCAGFEAGAGFNAATLADNSLFGYRAGFAISSGNQNTFLGSGAGSAVTTGSNNIAIGFNAALDSITASNQINIGNIYYHDRITGSKMFTGNVGFYSATPVAQPSAVADATDAASAITQLNALLARLRSLGLIAT